MNLNCREVHAVPPSRGRGGVITITTPTSYRSLAQLNPQESNQRYTWQSSNSFGHEIMKSVGGVVLFRVTYLVHAMFRPYLVNAVITQLH